MSGPIPALPPTALRLLRYWKIKRGPHVLPHNAAIDPILLREWLSNLSIIEYRPNDEGEFFVRLHGMETIEDLGQDFTRQYIEACTEGEATDLAIRPYRASMDTLMPIYATIDAEPVAGVFSSLDRLILPFTDIDQNDPDAPVSVDRFVTWAGPTDRMRGEDTAVYQSGNIRKSPDAEGNIRAAIELETIDVDDARYDLDRLNQSSAPFAAQRPLAIQA